MNRWFCCYGATLFRGRNYQGLRADVEAWKSDRMIVVHWPSWAELAANVDLRQEISLAIVPGSDITAFILRPAQAEYHLIFGTGSSASIIFEETQRTARKVTKLVLEPTENEALQAILSNAAYLLGS